MKGSGKPDKKDVAHVLEEIAVLLQLQGENVFKARAYENAARALDRLQEPLDQLIREGKLRQVRGIGASTARVIETYYETGEIPPLLRELREKTPPGLLELLQIPGLGPGRIRILHEKLGIQSLADLEYALQEHRVQQLEGFGSRIIERIEEGIALVRAHAGKFLLGQAYPVARDLARWLGQVLQRDPAIVGSLRRWYPVVRNINLLVPGPVEPHLREAMESAPMGVAWQHTETTVWTGVVVDTGIPLELVWVDPENWPWALRYYTGSREHNQRLEGWAREQGLSWKDGRLYKNGHPVPVRGEEEIFQALGLPYLPPEVREGRDEIERAHRGPLPRLLDWKDIRGVLHVHSAYSDGADALVDLVREARQRGLEYIGISDHSQAAHYASGLDGTRLRAQWAEIEEVQKAHPDVKILRGMEVDILPDGRLDLEDELLAQLDFVVASVHSRFRMREAEMTERLVRAMRHPCTTILGHPTGRLLLGRKGYAVDLEQVFRVAAETGTLLEINANPHRLDLDWTVLDHARSLGVMFSIDPDTHRRSDLGDYIYGVGIARKGWLSPDVVANTRAWPDLLDLFRRLKPRR